MDGFTGETVPKTEQRVELRARLLAGAIQRRVGVLQTAIAPPGTRPPFTVQMGKNEALAWWQKHRYDEVGAQVLVRYQPEQVLALDAELARHIESQQMQDYQEPATPLGM